MIKKSIKLRVRKTLLFVAALLTSIHILAVGFTPTDAGLVLNFEPGDEFLLSVMIDGKEYFVCDYPSYTSSTKNGDKFNYEAGNYLKLIPLPADVTEPPSQYIWKIDTALTRIKNKVDYSLGGISYTMWSSNENGNTPKTLITADKSDFKFLGNLAATEVSGNAANLCDVVFAVPTVRATTNMDPNNTLALDGTYHRGTGDQSWAFDGKMDYNSTLGMYYREVYWFDLPRSNGPNTYTNASLVTFNTTNSQKSWSDGQIKCNPGRAAYAYADNKHKPTQRTLFRIYVLNKPFSSCSSYFLGWDVQDYKKYRNSNTMSDSTSARKIYTLDHFACMEREGETAIFKSPDGQIQTYDSAYIYVGKDNKFYSEQAGVSLNDKPEVYSEFHHIKTFRVRALADAEDTYSPGPGAYGCAVIDSTSDKPNLGVTFEPKGYFFQTSSGVNVPMRQTSANTWMSEEMWYINGVYMDLKGRVMLYTDSVFSMSDPGAEIIGWSQWVEAKKIHVAGADPEVTAEGKYGWPRIHTNDPNPNGGIEFVVADVSKYIRYDNNGHFGAAIPKQYPLSGATTVTIEAPRLLGDYEFICWTDVADTTAAVSFTKYKPGDPYTFTGTGEVTLYAQAKYNGSIYVAISFLEGGKRYFMTHPNSSAPRYARARHFDEWTNTWQGMANAENTDPNYMSSFKMIVNPVCVLCNDSDVVLDPHHETAHGAIDSLVFYENFTPPAEEYIGLYYTSALNTVLANTTWAGIFKSTEGWPTPANPCIENTKLYSTHYFTGMETKDYKKNWRAEPDTSTPEENDSIALDAYIKYRSGQFDGVAKGEATDFMISGVGVVDEHYVLLPDTTDATTPWRDSIIFAYHEEVQHEQVWSKLIGKQLLAQMKVEDDTIYFHPNSKKIYNTASGLRLSNDFRLRQEFEFLYDKRPAVAGLIKEGDSVRMEETSNAFCCNIYSGDSTPIGPTVDIVDTLRVWLRPASTSKIKEYYGRWKNNKVARVLPDGSRYKDILIKTRTYHYGDTVDHVILKPELDVYNFGALAGQSQIVTFNLIRERTCTLYDSKNNAIRTDVVGRDTVKNVLNLTSVGTTATLKSDAFFTIGTKTATGITLTTKAENSLGDNLDTLTVTTNVTINTVAYNDLTVKVPLLQTDLTGEELVWSAVHPTTGKRFFITIESGALQFRAFDLNNSRWQRNKQELKLGSKNDGNTDHQYITPWKFSYSTTNANQLALKTEYGVNRYFKIAGGTPGVSDKDVKDSVLLTYEYVHVYTNDNANIEEQVKLKYGENGWLQFTGTRLKLNTNPDSATVFSWGYLSQEYELLNNGTYPSVDSLVFGYNNGSGKTVQTRYKAYREYSMLVNNQLTYLCRVDSTDLSKLTSDKGDWKLNLPSVTRKADERTFTFEDGAKTSNLGSPSLNSSTLITTITPNSATSPTGVKFGGKYVNIVDTLIVTLSPQEGAPTYRFRDWKGVSSFEDAALKIPLVRKTYHTAPYDSVICEVMNEEYNYAFPATLPKDKLGKDSTHSHTFELKTFYYSGTKTLDVDDNVVAYTANSTVNLTESMDFTNINLAEIRLIDEYGKSPDWCEITGKTANTLTVRCTKEGTRSPRLAYIYFAYIVTDGSSNIHFVNSRLTVSQSSLFKYANNQTLTHSRGITGDEKKANGMQQVHENKRILYYYNPAPYEESDQDVELPVRERGYYGWWRWYREGKDEAGFDCSDMDILDSLWIQKPRNVGKYNYSFRIIGDSVEVDNPAYPGTPGAPAKIKKLVQMGRYTVFHYPSRDYNTKVDPPSKSPLVKAPQNEKTLTYVVDISNYYDNLPLSLTQMNQVDTARLDTMKEITEPTLSLREIFELHPWTEMAEKLDHYKSKWEADEYVLKDEHYMEDHVVMAPTGNRLLLSTEQRYRYTNLEKKGHSESLLGYYMRDDNWNKTDGSWTITGETEEEIAAKRKACQDTMIWCGGWEGEVACEWYTYDPDSKRYTPCTHTVTESDDFLSVPAKGSITGNAADTVYYCLRARSKKTTDPADPSTSADGDSVFNICRYKVIYHNPNRYGPKLETGTGSAAKAIIHNDEIEQNYEVLERLNFDYIQPGENYHVYPRPLPWADASYGYSYPVGPEIPDNRYHNDIAPNFPGPGEYSLINRIPYSNYWRKFEQHGGAANGYMLYCDGMSSSGQVAALSLSTHLCEGQKMYFSGYIGNVSNQKGKSNPNFTFAVQGSADGETWEDITTYMTGDIQPSDNWYQIFFPIEHEKVYDDFRIRIYNMASDFDGNDFIIDDMCVFATKPPLIAYQANTKCVEANENDSIIHVVLRVDYQGFTDVDYNGANVTYTVEEVSKDKKDTCFVPMLDHYVNEDVSHTGRVVDDKKVAPDTIFGAIPMPARDYYPMNEDSIFSNLNDLAARFQTTYEAHEAWDTANVETRGPEPAYFRRGYLYENLDGEVRPVLYVVHNAKMTADKQYKVRMSLNYTGLMSSKCAMTSELKVTNRMMLMLDGEEQEEKEVSNMCANTIYDVSIRVRGTLIQDSVAPKPLTGSCSCDWLLYGDTLRESSKKRYGYYYSDIEKVIRHILRYEPGSNESNSNRFAHNIGEVNRNVMENIKKTKGITLDTTASPYDILVDLVNKGFLTLYEQDVFVNVNSKDSVSYVVFPITGTGTDDLQKQDMEVCPMPIIIKLKSRTTETPVPLIIGGLHRDSTQMKQPIIVLADAENANKELHIPVDSIRTMIGIHAISLLSTDDPDYREGVHRLSLTPDRVWPRDMSRYYTKIDTLHLTPASSNNYEMQSGYNYTFNIEMVTATDNPNDGEGCPIGNVPFVVSVVPDVLRWAPTNRSNNCWNDPMNWIGVTKDNEELPITTRFAPLSTTDIIIPAMTDGMPYPVLPDLSAPTHADSVQEVGFVYNICDDIRFLPGAALGEQQRLTKDVVVVDMNIPNQTWVLRSAPVKGMVGGDLFMANADLNGESKMWTVGTFDADARNYKLGNASFWLSVYNRATYHKEADDTQTERPADALWSKVTNFTSTPLSPAQGWSVFTHTKSETAANVRLPKSDDRYYYFNSYGGQIDGVYDEPMRGEGAGQLAYQPTKVGESYEQTYSLSNSVASNIFVFGNPTMGYIDIWGLIADNASLKPEISFFNYTGEYEVTTRETALATSNALSNEKRYLPPMHGMVLYTAANEAKTALDIKVKTSRVVADTVATPAPPAAAPALNRQSSNRPLTKGIMTVTSVNAADAICTSRLLLGQGYHDAIREGEDAMLTTINIDKFTTSAPTTPLALYAVENGCALSIDLRDSIVNIPLSYSITNVTLEPETYLWFTGVNNIDGPLVLYDALLDTERPIADGICLRIETPETSHERRYYIRRPGYRPDSNTDPITTGISPSAADSNEQAYKIMRNGIVYILRDGHVYTIFGQKIR